jgi:hypothetical protein
MTKPKTPKALDAIADIVLKYRPKARSKPAVQRKRRRTILEKLCRCGHTRNRHPSGGPCMAFAQTSRECGCIEFVAGKEK